MAPEKLGDVLAGTDHVAAAPLPSQVAQRTLLDLWGLVQKDREPGGWDLVLCDLGQVTPSLDRSPCLTTAGLELCICDSLHPCLAVSLAVPLAACVLMSSSAEEASGMTLFHQKIGKLMAPKHFTIHKASVLHFI